MFLFIVLLSVFVAYHEFRKRYQHVLSITFFLTDVNQIHK